MAKILRTEQLSVDGDNIRLTADQGNLIINSVSGDDLVQITSTTKIGQDISSLSVRDMGFDAAVSSLAFKNAEAEALAVTASKYGAYGLETSNLSTGTGSNVQTITLAGRAFISKPIVTATLTGTANDPIIAVMVSDVSETSTSGVYQATFQFSDELPATGEADQATSYKLNIVACVSGTDADLDTIIDDMDSDRDGDGVENSLDYDPDDSSVASFSDTLKPSCDQVVLHLQPAAGETIADKISGNEATVVGSVTVDSTATLFGGDTINAAGNLTFAGISNNFMLGTQEVTMETWFQPKNSSIYNSIARIQHPTRNRTLTSLVYRGDITSVLSGNGGPNKWFMFLVNEGSGSSSTSNVYRVWNAFVSPVEIQSDTWYHLALVRQNTTWDLYINGQLSTLHTGTWVDGQTRPTTSEVQLEYEGTLGLFGFNGAYGDMFGQDFRISKKAVYTSNFTPPTSLLDNPC